MSLNPLTIIITADETRIVTNNNGYNSTDQINPFIKIQVLHDDTHKNIKKIKITYQDIYEEITNDYVFDGIHSSMCGEGNTMVDKIMSYSKNMSDEDKEIIMKEYNLYIDDGTVLDGFVAGIAVYLSILYLIENNLFTIPFEFSTPFSIESGNMVNRNILRLMSLPFIALSKTHDAILAQAVKFIQSFINIWEPAFMDGPIINTFNESKLCIEIVTGYSQYTTNLLFDVKNQNKQLHQEIQSAKEEFISYIDKLKQELLDLRKEVVVPKERILHKELPPIKKIHAQSNQQNTGRVSFKDWLQK